MSARANVCDLEGCDNEVLTDDQFLTNADNSTTVIPGNGHLGQIDGIPFDGCCKAHFIAVSNVILQQIEDKPQEVLPPPQVAAG